MINGPGEFREAGLGISCGNGKGQIFLRGRVVKMVPERQVADALIDEALHQTQQADQTQETGQNHHPAGPAESPQGDDGS